MKRALAPIVLVAVVVGAFLVHRYLVLDSPRDVLERIADVHEEHEGLDSHVTNYVDVMRAIGLPFRTSAGLTELVERIEEARETRVYVDGAEVAPWDGVRAHAPGAELLDGALRAVALLVDNAQRVEQNAATTRTAAVTYMVARERASADPSAANVRDVVLAAADLAAAVNDLRGRIEPLGGAIATASAQVDGATEWLAAVVPDGSAEGVVVGSVQTALRSLASAIQVPERHFDDVAARMTRDIEALTQIAGAAERMREPL